MPAFYASNSGYINPSVSVNNVNRAVETKNPEYGAPKFTITTSGSGDVHIQNFLSMYDGIVTIEWTGETSGALTAVKEVSNTNSGGTNAPIWANVLIIKNAASIGTANNPVNVWMTSIDSNPAVINVTAQGDIFLNAVPAVVTIKNVSTGNSSDPIRVDKVSSSAGDVDLTLGTVVDITLDPNTLIVTIPVPGALSYETVKVTLQVEDAEGSTIQGNDLLDRYQNGYDVATGLYSYLLPNGTVFWMDAFHNVSRIEENDTTMAVGDYTFQKDSSGKVTSIGLNNGVHIDLATGQLYVDPNASFDVLFSVVNAAQFFANGGFFANIKFRVSASKDAEGDIVSKDDIDGDGSDSQNPVGSVVEWDVKPIKFYEDGGSVVCYYLTGLAPDFETIDNAEGKVYYILFYDTATNSVELFSLSSPIEAKDISGNKDYFKYLTGGTHDDGSYLTVEGPNASSESRQPAYHIHLAKQTPEMSFKFENFAGTGYTAVIGFDASGNRWF